VRLGVAKAVRYYVLKCVVDQMIETISDSEIAAMLASKGLAIGEWGQVCASAPVNGSESVGFRPSTEGLVLYAVAHKLVDFVVKGDWVLIRFDNSNSFSSDELAVVNEFFCDKLTVRGENIMVRCVGDGDVVLGVRIKVVLFVYFALLFQWHVYIVPHADDIVQYVALLDGAVHLFGVEANEENRRYFVEDIMANPLRMPQ
jgi:hypothetical protein